MEWALNQMVRRHEVLRTRFAVSNGIPVQVVRGEVDLRVAVVDLQQVGEQSSREAEGERVVREEAMRPFDLEHGPLLRGLLLKLGVEEHVLVVSMHHIVSDGWSSGIMVRELCSCTGRG